MNATSSQHVIQVPGRLVPLAAMARLLEKLDRSSEPVDAAQYRHVVQRLQQRQMAERQQAAGERGDQIIVARTTETASLDLLHYI